MAYIDKQLVLFKQMIEGAIITGGAKGKESVIRSSGLINLIHDAVKKALIRERVNPDHIYPHLGATKPEIKLAGFLKQKDQDVCVVPSHVRRVASTIDWGPLKFLKKVDPYGMEYSEKTLVINVRSQMSSLAKNLDTLFERTVAEADNLHRRYPKMVLGEVYLIPLYAYDSDMVKKNVVGFSRRKTDVAKYISLFNAINNRTLGGEDYCYERCALLVVDFSKNKPRLFHSSAELEAAGIIPKGFPIEYATLGFHTFAKDILAVYAKRFDIQNLLK